MAQAILGAYPEQSTYSSADFLRKVVAAFARCSLRYSLAATRKPDVPQAGSIKVPSLIQCPCT